MTIDMGVMKACNAAKISEDEMNKLDGLTANTAELNILDGVTADATEINKLDGLLASTSELNSVFLFGRIPDVSTQNSAAFVVSPVAGTLSKIYTVLEGAIITAPAVLTASVDGGTNVTATISITHTSSAEGDVDSCVPADNNAVSVGSYLKLNSAGASGNTIAADVIFEITLT